MNTEFTTFGLIKAAANLTLATVIAERYIRPAVTTTLQAAENIAQVVKPAVTNSLRKKLLTRHEQNKLNDNECLHWTSNSNHWTYSSNKTSPTNI